MLCEHCAATAMTLLCCQHWFRHKSKAQRPPIPTRPSALPGSWISCGWLLSSLRQRKICVGNQLGRLAAGKRWVSSL